MTSGSMGKQVVTVAVQRQLDSWFKRGVAIEEPCAGCEKRDVCPMLINTVMLTFWHHVDVVARSN